MAGGRGAAGRALWGAWSKFREAAERELTQAQHSTRLRGVGCMSLRELEALRCEAAEKQVASPSRSFLCPIGDELMREPVMDADGPAN